MSSREGRGGHHRGILLNRSRKFWCKQSPSAWNLGDNGQMGAVDLFKGRHFNWEVIVLCVGWYLGFKLSSRDLVQMMAERGIALTHTTILRWVQRYVPEFEKRWTKYSRPVGGSWRCDETYIKVKGGWTYLYRAVDKQGRTVDFLLSERRDVAAAKRFFSKAMKKHGTPRVITLDAYAASHRAITELKSAGHSDVSLILPTLALQVATTSNSRMMPAPISVTPGTRVVGPGIAAD
jgi:transposase-like protein